jgi:hypothetical protein
MLNNSLTKRSSAVKRRIGTLLRQRTRAWCRPAATSATTVRTKRMGVLAEGEMSGKTAMVVFVIAAAVLAGIVAMHGKGHEALRKWLPAIHGGHR